MLKDMSAKRQISLPSFEPIPLHAISSARACRDVAQTALDILSQVDDITINEETAPMINLGENNSTMFDTAPCFEPIPIGPNGIEVVEHVQLTSVPWQCDDENFSLSFPDLLTTKSSTYPNIQPSTSSSTNQQDVMSRSSVSDDDNDSNVGDSSNDPSSNKTKKSSNSGSSIRATQSEQWNQRLGDLISFRKEFGHCLVPLNWKRNTSLSHWVKRQRYQYNLKLEGRHSTMTQQRELTLKNLGFVWDSHAAAWEERWNELRDFRELHNHCNVPTKYPENPQLSVWVKCQRRQFKLLRSGKKSTMTRERVTRLFDLGFVFDPRRLQKVERF